MKQNKLLHKTKHLSLLETEKGFVYAERRTVNSVACLIFKKEIDHYLFLIRYQPMPEIKEKKFWTDLYPCPITGSIEKNEKPIDSAIREVYEEGGIRIGLDRIVGSSISISSTQTNEKVFNFLIDSTNCIQETPNGDGTIFESISVNKWVTNDELLRIIFDKNQTIHLSSLETCYLLFLKYKNIL